ncbi:MAG TPA: hypothetical protein VH796_12530 [Nitrososphaeraceae archaeon]|jgi:hypothetical protein
MKTSAGILPVSVVTTTDRVIDIEDIHKLARESVHNPSSLESCTNMENT